MRRDICTIRSALPRAQSSLFFKLRLAAIKWSKQNKDIIRLQSTLTQLPSLPILRWACITKAFQDVLQLPTIIKWVYAQPKHMNHLIHYPTENVIPHTYKSHIIAIILNTKILYHQNNSHMLIISIIRLMYTQQ